ncbi:MAG: hypothetical protein K2H25_06485, partial [Alistipes sp.]|nr:hypothetical protein [Alistipes sp.]
FISAIACRFASIGRGRSLSLLPSERIFDFTQNSKTADDIQKTDESARSMKIKNRRQARKGPPPLKPDSTLQSDFGLRRNPPQLQSELNSTQCMYRHRPVLP